MTKHTVRITLAGDDIIVEFYANSRLHHTQTYIDPTIALRAAHNWARTETINWKSAAKS